jgi:hypothetical protein
MGTPYFNMGLLRINWFAAAPAASKHLSFVGQ